MLKLSLKSAPESFLCDFQKAANTMTEIRLRQLGIALNVLWHMHGFKVVLEYFRLYIVSIILAAGLAYFF